MAQSVQAAQAQANKNRVPLVIAVTETHDAARDLARESGVLNGNSVVLSVPRTASRDLNFLNQASSSNIVPRVHVFPPAENATRMQPQNIQQEIQQYTPFWVRLAGEVNRGTGNRNSSVNEVTSVLQSFGAAASAWNTAQQQQKQQQKQQQSPTRQDAAPASPKPAAATVQPLSNTNNNTDAADPSPTLRVIPKVHIRLHHSAPPSADLPHVPPQPRNTPLPTLRKLIAKFAEKSFGDNFLFVEKNSNVMVRAANEGPLIAQDVSHGADLYVCPVALASPPPTAPAVPVKQDAAAASSSTTTTTSTATSRPSPSTSSSASGAAGLSLRIKITYPDNSDEVVRSLTPSSTAAELRDYIKSKYTSKNLENFIIQLPQSRIKDDEMDKTLQQLGMRGGVAIRVVDLDALKEEREKYEQQQNEEQQASSLLSGLMSKIRGGPSSSTSPPPPPTDEPPKTSGGPPRSMADIRRQQEEEAERKKKEAERNGKGSNEYYGGAGTNTQAPPPDDDRPK